jgi:Zn-dependent peptidase ImmA (M78 family)
VARIRAHVTPEVLRWARESIGYDVEDAASRIGVKPEQLERAESGDLMLTLLQAEKAADVYERPFAALFLPEPPAEEPQAAQFRRLAGAPAPPWPPEMRLLVRRVRARQAAAVELFEAIDESPPWPAAAEDLAVAGRPLPELVRELLGISIDEQTSWRDRQGYTGLRRWTDAVERLGILVMQDGSMSVATMRGFAARHAEVPVIVVNTQDDPRARVFTLIHELGHLYLTALLEPARPSTEFWCDEFAGDVLLPRPSIESVLDEMHGRAPLAITDELALRFGVTPLAAAVRIRKEELWDEKRIKQVIAHIKSREHPKPDPGGDYYRTQIGRLGPTYARLVFAALDSQAVTYPAASSLLDGVKVNNFSKLRDYLDRRASET